MLNVKIPYPDPAEELEILRRTTGDDEAAPEAILSAEQILSLQHLVRRLPVAEHVFLYARDLIRATRPAESEAAPLVKRCVSWGAGPRAGQSLILAAKARAALQGRLHAGIGDVRAVARPVLRHRIVTTFHAEAEGITSDSIIAHLLETVPPATDHAASRLEREL